MSGELQIREQGWSLTEVLTVLAITGLLAALAWPSYQTMAARVQARSATSEIASELRLARQLAMARRERLRVIFDQEGRTISLRRVGAEAILHVYHYADKGVVLEEPTAGPELLFYPSGRSATPTTIRVRDSQGRETTFTVSITGRVSIS
jgi:type IV fimbrial biogenesis protein FimT